MSELRAKRKLVLTGTPAISNSRLVFAGLNAYLGRHSRCLLGLASLGFLRPLRYHHIRYHHEDSPSFHGHRGTSPADSHLGFGRPGTPLQNHVAELWSILNFLGPASKFGSVEQFLSKFGSLSTGGGTAKQVHKLNKLLKPHLLRREKEDVEHSLPGMQEMLLYVEITNLQKMCYRAVLERNRELLLRGAGTAGLGPSFNNVSMMLRHCCNHPWLLPDVEEGALLQAFGRGEDGAR